MGLLDVLNSEQGRLGLGLLAAAGGRSDGAGFGQRMAEGIGSVDQWKKQQAQAKFQQMQADEMQAQVEARKAKAIEDARIKALIQGLGQPKPGMGAGLPAGTLPGAFDIGSQVPALEQSGKIDFQALMRQGVPFEILKNLAESANLGKQKVARTAEIEGANGQKIVQGFDDYGQRVGQGENGYIAPVMVDQGGTKGFQKPVAGASFPVSMSPSERDSSARGWASNALAKERFNYDKSQDVIKAQAVPPEKPLTDAQSKAALFGSRMEAANRVLESLAKSGETTSIPGSRSGYGIGATLNVLSSSKQQQLNQAKRDFVNAVLRRESGAVISDAEFDNAEKQYFPQVGDKPDNIKQKEDARAIAIRGVQAEVPKASRGVLDEIQGNRGATGGWSIEKAP